MSSTAERIKEKLSIVDVIGSHIKLEKAGANYKARCPFHNEKTPSFMVSPTRNSYYCFGCQASGDIFSFVQEFEKLDFVGALKLLADKAGVTIDDFHNGADKARETRLRKVLSDATKIYAEELKSGPVKTPLEYLTNRGLTKTTIEEWQIGFAPEQWRFIQDRLIKQKVAIEELLDVGLVKRKSDGGTDTYDRFRNRIMFPIADSNGNIVGFSGRIMGKEQEGSPKYLNSPETALFNKSEIMYGLHKAKDGIRKWGYAIVVEGQMDLLMCHQAGFTNALATSGTSLTKGHLEKIKRYSEKLMIVYDADSAGVRASIRAWALSLSLGLDVKIAILPKGEDPASLILKNPEEFKTALKNTKHVVEFVLEQILSRYPKGDIKMHSREIGKAVNVELLPLVARIESAIDKSHFVALISDKTFIPLESIQEDLKKTKPIDIQTYGADEPMNSEDNSRDSHNGNKTGPGTSHEGTGDIQEKGLTELDPEDKVIFETVKRLAGIVLLESPQLNKNAETGEEKVISEEEKPSEEETGSLPTLAKQHALRVKTEVHRIINDSHTQIANEFERLLADAPQKLIFETELLYKGSQNIDKEIDYMLTTLEESILKKAFGDHMREMQIAEKAGDKPLALKLLVDCQELSHKMSALQHKRMNLV